MIEIGTPDELKLSILGNVCWSPTPDDCIVVKKAFEAQDLTVTQCFVTSLQPGVPRYRPNVFPTIKVYFQTKRGVEGAMAKTMRALRALRLSMFQFTEETPPKMSKEAIKVYSVEMRGYD
jgi:hypothetical protein